MNYSTNKVQTSYIWRSENVSTHITVHAQFTPQFGYQHFVELS